MLGAPCAWVSAISVSIGVRQFEQGDRDAAAASFQLTLTLLSLFGDTPAGQSRLCVTRNLRGPGPR